MAIKSPSSKKQNSLQKKTKPFDQSGFGLLEAMVGMVLVGLVGIGAMKMVEGLSRSSKIAGAGAETSVLRSQILTLLSVNSQTCLASLRDSADKAPKFNPDAVLPENPTDEDRIKFREANNSLSQIKLGSLVVAKLGEKSGGVWVRELSLEELDKHLRLKTTVDGKEADKFISVLNISLSLDSDPNKPLLGRGIRLPVVLEADSTTHELLSCAFAGVQNSNQDGLSTSWTLQNIVTYKTSDFGYWRQTINGIPAVALNNAYATPQVTICKDNNGINGNGTYDTGDSICAADVASLRALMNTPVLSPQPACLSNTSNTCPSILTDSITYRARGNRFIIDFRANLASQGIGHSTDLVILMTDMATPNSELTGATLQHGENQATQSQETLSAQQSWNVIAGHDYRIRFRMQSKQANDANQTWSRVAGMALSINDYNVPPAHN